MSCWTPHDMPSIFWCWKLCLPSRCIFATEYLMSLAIFCKATCLLECSINMTSKNYRYNHVWIGFLRAKLISLYCKFVFSSQF